MEEKPDLASWNGLPGGMSSDEFDARCAGLLKAVTDPEREAIERAARTVGKEDDLVLLHGLAGLRSWERLPCRPERADRDSAASTETASDDSEVRSYDSWRCPAGCPDEEERCGGHFHRTVGTLNFLGDSLGDFLEDHWVAHGARGNYSVSARWDMTGCQTRFEPIEGDDQLLFDYDLHAIPQAPRMFRKRDRSPTSRSWIKCEIRRLMHYNLLLAFEAAARHQKGGGPATPYVELNPITLDEIEHIEVLHCDGLEAVLAIHDDTWRTWAGEGRRGAYLVQEHGELLPTVWLLPSSGGSLVRLESPKEREDAQAVSFRTVDQDRDPDLMLRFEEALGDRDLRSIIPRDSGSLA